MAEITAVATSAPSLLRRWSDAVLTTEPRRRAVLSMWAISFGTYILYSGVGLVAVLCGLANGVAVGVLVGAMAVHNLTIFVCLRAGVARASTLDRDLGLTQLLSGIVFMWLTYALAGPAGPATLIIMSSHIVYAMFTMPPAHVRRLVVFSLTGIAATVTISWRIDANRYPIEVQIVSVAYAVIVLPLIARLANQVTAMNERLRSQRRELAAALDQVRLLASSDDLTKAHNRRHMVELMHTQRAGLDDHAPLCLALLDIDFFKSVNDRFGHASGDEVLRIFADQAKRVLRQTDLFARWGGEEFMAMFVGTPATEAEQILGRLRDEVASTDYGIDGLSVTFSAGLVEVLCDEALEQAIERADQEMYRAKSSGRNRTCRSIATELSHHVARTVHTA